MRSGGPWSHASQQRTTFFTCPHASIATVTRCWCVLRHEDTSEAEQGCAVRPGSANFWSGFRNSDFVTIERRSAERRLPQR
mmetsp:Transcript_22886/g.57810  ORF Transcript_22886/g.57810 Transcript_22886/m.57810 type:complete len:81 (+) Transcript_22886:600-842(+)